MKQIEVRMTVPLPPSWGGGNGEMIFHRWVPSSGADRICLSANGVTTYLWFDALDAEEIAGIADSQRSRINIQRSTACILVETEVSEDLATALLTRSFPPSLPEALQCEYTGLQSSIHGSAVELVNRVIAYVRSVKAQYWLGKFAIGEYEEAINLVEFNTQVRKPGGEWVKWMPAGSGFRGHFVVDESRYVTTADWDSICLFVKTSKNPPFVDELLANAEALVAQGVGRSAVVEAVSAMEVALAVLGSEEHAQSSWARDLDARVPLESLSRHIAKLGLRGSLSYLIPILFSENQVPRQVLDGAIKAVNARNVIAHQGQRQIEIAVARDHVVAIRRLCYAMGVVHEETLTLFDPYSTATLRQQND